MNLRKDHYRSFTRTRRICYSLILVLRRIVAALAAVRRRPPTLPRQIRMSWMRILYAFALPLSARMVGFNVPSVCRS